MYISFRGDTELVVSNEKQLYREGGREGEREGGREGREGGTNSCDSTQIHSPPSPHTSTSKQDTPTQPHPLTPTCHTHLTLLLAM